MKRIFLVGWMGVVFLFLSTSIYAAQGMYLSGNLGMGMLRDTDATFPPYDNIVRQSKESVEEYMGGTYQEEYNYNLKFDAGVAFNIAAGYDFGNNFRIEGEIGYQKNDVDQADYSYDYDVYFDYDGYVFDYDDSDSGKDIVSGDVTSLSFMVNAYYDFANSSPVTPFVSLGVGFVKVEYDLSSEFIGWYMIYDIDEDYNYITPDGSDSTTVAAYQLGTGIGFALNSHLTLDLKYRFFATEDPEFGDVNVSYQSHNVYVGTRISF